MKYAIVKMNAGELLRKEKEQKNYVPCGSDFMKKVIKLQGKKLEIISEDECSITLKYPKQMCHNIGLDGEPRINVTGIMLPSCLVDKI